MLDSGRVRGSLPKVECNISSIATVCVHFVMSPAASYTLSTPVIGISRTTRPKMESHKRAQTEL